MKCFQEGQTHEVSWDIQTIEIWETVEFFCNLPLFLNSCIKLAAPVKNNKKMEFC